MAEMDKKLDDMFRVQLIAMIRENAGRVHKIFIRYTKMQQKYCVENLDALCATYERLIRNIIKQMLNIEKSSRLKFLVGISEERIFHVTRYLNQEVELLFVLMEKEIGVRYVALGLKAEFDRRMQEGRLHSKESLESQVAKMAEQINTQVGGTEKIPPKELSRIYDIEESTLRDMNLIQPLQDIHTIFNQLKENGGTGVEFEEVHKGIAECVQFGKKVERLAPSVIGVKERKAMRMQIAREALALKEVILCIWKLAEQAKMDKEKRNYDLISKNRQRIDESLSGNPESDNVVAKFKTLYELLEA